MGNVRNLIFCNFAVWKETQWFWSINFNALFSRNIVSGEVERRSKYIKYSKKGNGAAYNNVVLYNNKIIAIPGRERKIMILDMETECFRYINLEIPFIKEEDNAFFAYVESGKWLFMIGNQIPYILKLDMDSEHILKIVNLGTSITDRAIYFRDAVLDKEQLLIPLMDENIVFEVDINTLQWTKRTVGTLKKGFSAICRSADSVWLMSRQQGAVLQWNREDNRVIIHKIEKEEVKYKDFHAGHFIGKRIWMFPSQGNMVLSLDAKTGELIKENAINRYIKALQSEKCAFRAVQMEQENFFLLCFCADKWVHMIYDPQRDKLEVSKLKCEITYEELYKRGIEMVDEKDLPLEKFMDYLIANGLKDRKEFDLTKYDHVNQIWKTIH